MNIKYNYDYLKCSMILSAVSCMAVLYYYLFKNSYIVGFYNADRVAAALFYTNGAISIIMVWIVDFRRKILEKDLKLNKKSNTLKDEFFSMGLFKFCSNRNAAWVDLLLSVLILNQMINYVLEIGSILYRDIAIIIVLWLLYIHSILNGKNYIFFKKLYEIESEAIDE